jgi:uncharacterized membrane protein YhaH (DUF805 family)
MPLSQLLFSFEGRIPRSTWWLSSIVLSLVNMAVVMTMGPLADENSLGAVMLIPLLAWFAFLVIASLALQVKRWHDRDKSGWWILIGFVPIIGGIWAFIECGCLRGTDGPNQFGPDPLNPGSDDRDF